jgi:acyl carrier protein
MNEVEPVQDTVCKILSDVLHESVADLLAQPVLAAYEWDSLSSLEALSQLESRLAITLDLRSFQAVRTIEDLVDLVSSVQRPPARTAAGQR